MPLDEEKVLRSRALRETAITSVNSLYEQALIIKDNPEQFSNFKIRCRNLEKWKNSFEKQHINLISVLAIQEGAEINLAAELAIYKTFEEKYQFIDTIYYELFDLPEENRLNRSNSEIGKYVNNVKLPKINLVTFEGDIKKFPSFISNFNALVHENQTLSNIEKFNYLISILKGPPLNSVKCLPLIEDNYLIAYNSLISRYDNKRLLATAYWKEIQNFKPITSDQYLRSLLDTFHENLSALQTLGFIVADWNFILMQMLLDRLDSDTLKNFEKEYASSEIPSYDTVREILLKHCKVVESISLNTKVTSKNISSEHKHKQYSQKTSFLASTSQNTAEIPKNVGSNYRCIHCKGNHIIFNCPNFISKEPRERFEIVKKCKACINCLADSHSLNNCTSSKKCRICQKSHHTMIHFPIKPIVEQNETTSLTQGNVSESFTGLASNESKSFPQILLATVQLKIQDSFGEFHLIRGIVDSGSQLTFLSRNIAKKLNLKLFNASISVQGLDHMCTSAKSGVQCHLRSTYNNDQLIKVDAVIVDKICEAMPSNSLSLQSWNQFSNLLLADPEFYRSNRIDILLGADIFPYILQNGKIETTPGEPVAINTIFGWVIMGKINVPRNQCIKSFLTLSTEHNAIPLDDTLRRFWEIEEVPSVNCESPEDIFCEKYYTESTSRKSDGRYTVSLPFKTNCPDFGDTRNLALKRFNTLESRLLNDTELYTKYSSLIQEYLDSDHMEIVPLDQLESKENTFYLPHSYVIKKDSLTTPIRIVFDGSSRNPNKMSLNDALFTGPKLQSNLISILLQFRLHKYVFCSDIRQMYRMIEVTTEHRNYLRILWRFSITDPIKEYRLKVVPFGLVCSPYLAIRTLLQLTKDYPEFNLAGEIIQNTTYVDDVSGGDNTIEKAKIKIQQLVTLLDKGGFELRKWCSNSADLLQNIDHSHINHIPLELNSKDNIQKILGLKWEPSSDCFSFSTLAVESTCTKRSILSCVARIFDPLGYLTPCTIFLKLLIQSLWCQGTSWDTSPPEEIRTKFLKFREQLTYFSDIKIPRFYEEYLSTNKCDLIGFSDSSESSYCGIVYFRIPLRNSYKFYFVCAKSKVAPLKKLSVPRLELCAAVLLSKLILFVTHSYSNKINFENIFAYSDSKVVLTWIKSSPHKWKSFVSNRTSYIQDIVPSDKWRYIPSENNPADKGTRGLSPRELLECKIWWEGPSNFRDDLDHDIVTTADVQEKSKVLEEATKSCFMASVPEEDFIFTLLSKFSNLDKIITIVCYILRFINNLKFKDKRKYSGENINSSEIHNALVVITKSVQQKEFTNELKCLSSGRPISKGLRKLTPFIDKDGLIRVGGRLAHSKLNYDGKYPMLLPSKHIFTKLLVSYIHNNFLHSGVNTTSFHLLQMFWVFSVKRVVRSVISKCHSCFKTNPRSVQPSMGNLPKFRVTGAKPFLNTGVDLGGPFTIAMNKVRGAKTLKAYLALFICCATKAVHLELISDLSAECFLMGLRRFLARRGRCLNIYSDCGTNFVASSKYIDQIMKNAALKEKISWHFNPPSAPHMGGIWEANIKSVKSHLLRLIGLQILTYEELNTLFIRIEAVMNSRPLCPLNSDPNDINALTPGHFLTLEPLVTLPDPDYSQISLNRLTRWQVIQRMHRDFWNRWTNEYLHTLNQKSKWIDSRDTLKEGTMVLIKNEQSVPLLWPLGRIVKLYHGTDGVARVAQVKTANGFLKRPLVKLCPLPNN